MAISEYYSVMSVPSISIEVTANVFILSAPSIHTSIHVFKYSAGLPVKEQEQFWRK